MMGLKQLGAGEKQVASDLRCRVEHPATGVDDLGEALRTGAEAVPSLAEARVGLFAQRRDVRGPRAQAVVDRAVEIGGEAQVEKEARGAEHERHHRGERQREPEADRHAAQRPPSFLSR